MLYLLVLDVQTSNCCLKSPSGKLLERFVNFSFLCTQIYMFERLFCAQNENDVQRRMILFSAVLAF